MSQVRSGHQRCAGIARRAGHQPGQSGGGAAQRQEGRLAQGQAKEEARRMIGQPLHGTAGQLDAVPSRQQSVDVPIWSLKP